MTIHKYWKEIAIGVLGLLCVFFYYQKTQVYTSYSKLKQKHTEIKAEFREVNKEIERSLRKKQSTDIVTRRVIKKPDGTEVREESRKTEKSKVFDENSEKLSSREEKVSRKEKEATREQKRKVAGSSDVYSVGLSYPVLGSGHASEPDYKKVSIQASRRLFGPFHVTGSVTPFEPRILIGVKVSW